MVWRRDEIAPWLHEVLFASPDAAAAHRALSAATTVRDAIEATDDPGVADLLQRLAVEETDAEPRAVLERLVDGAANRTLSSLENEARVVDDPFRIGETIAWLKLRIMELREPDTNEAALEQLLGWLTGRPEEGA
jgi:hypothetical protein